MIAKGAKTRRSSLSVAKYYERRHRDRRGRVLRRAGTFTAFDHAKIVAEAREAAFGLRDKAKWPT